MRLFAVVSYEGSAYQGWQKQPSRKTVQETIENQLSLFFNTEINIYASGRTDAGVHAYGQTFHFDVDRTDIDLDRLLYSINSMLPEDISILSFDLVDDDFHARYNAIKKQYIYLIEKGKKDPFMYKLCDVEKEPFDNKKLKEALDLFVGKHNFQNFTSKEEDEANFIREIYSIDVLGSDIACSITFVGNGFMRYMIRDIVGTALVYAKGKISLDEIKDLINCKSKKRKIVSFKAPANGLYLDKVFY